MDTYSQLAVIGGTFNPFHIGHLRLAIEVSEALGNIRTDFIPCFHAPHKEETCILPFDLRSALIKVAIQGQPCLCVNNMEKSRSGPSYTCDTLLALRERQGSHVQIYFCLGLEDFMTLDTWKNGLDLPSIANFIVIPRNFSHIRQFRKTVERFWSESSQKKVSPFAESFFLPQKTWLHLLAIPQIQISASLVRARWREKRNISGLVPEPTHLLMQQHQDEITACWERETDATQHTYMKNGEWRFPVLQATGV